MTAALRYHLDLLWPRTLRRGCPGWSFVFGVEDSGQRFLLWCYDERRLSLDGTVLTKRDFWVRSES